MATIFSLADVKSDRMSTSLKRSLNPNNLTLDGSSLEVQAAVAIARATHYSYPRNSNVPSFSLKSHDGINFLKNLVFELTDTTLSFDKFSFDFAPDLVDYLSKFRIPFLYGLNRSNELLDEYSSLVAYDLYARQYQRTGNAAQIDGIFSAYFRETRNEVAVACECKNRKLKVNATLLLKILHGFRRNEAKLGIVVCHSSVNTPTNTSNFFAKCAQWRVQVYRLRTFGRKFTIEPFFRSQYQEGSQPSMSIIILETLRINSYRH